MRKIGIQEIEDIALGAALLGAGGGGDPYIGKLTAIGAVKECGEVELIGADEVPEGAFIMPAASMGAPTILAEKGVGFGQKGCGGLRRVRGRGGVIHCGLHATVSQEIANPFARPSPRS